MRSGIVALVLALTASACAADPAAQGSLLARLRERLAGRAAAAPPRSPPRRGERMVLGGVKVAVWRPTTPRPHPLVIFSHGLHGMAEQSKFLTTALADHGYLVISPEHRDSVPELLASRGSWKPEVGLGKTAQWTDATYRDRRDDLFAIVGALRAQPEWSGAVDWSRFVLAGHSLGGYTALGCAGAWPSWSLPGVKAVLALSPYGHPFSRQHTLGGVRVPVMYQSGTLDPGVTPFVRQPGGMFEQTVGPAYMVVFEQASHFAFSDVPSPAHEAIVDYALAFLDHHAGGDRKLMALERRPGIFDVQSH